MSNANPAIVIACFATPSAAREAIDALRAANFERQQIGYLSRSSERPGDGGAPGSPANPDAATAGILGAGIAAGAVGAAPVMPGTGPILTGGALGAALIASGALRDGVRHALTGAGLADDEARHYESQCNAGRSIVIVKAALERVAEASKILKSHGGVGRLRS